MCNRFRALCSGLLLASLSGRKLRHCWEEEAPHALDSELIRNMRASSFATFFVESAAIPFQVVDKTTAIDQVFSEWAPGDYWYPLQNSAIRRSCWAGEIRVERTSADALIKSEVDTVLLETSLCLQPSSLTPSEFEHALWNIYAQHFEPLPMFRKVADRFASNGPYVGVHIRRGDHLRHLPSADISASNWVKIIRQNVSASESLYVCSDDEPFVRAVRGLLPDYRIMSVDQTFSAVPKFQAFSEFLCLSRALRIYGTVGSSFSREAARFGGVPFMHCLQTHEQLECTEIQGLDV